MGWVRWGGFLAAFRFKCQIKGKASLEFASLRHSWVQACWLIFWFIMFTLHFAYIFSPDGQSPGTAPCEFWLKDFSENVSFFLAREVVGVFSLFLTGALSCK